MKRLMLSCKSASELMEKRRHSKLTLVESMQLTLHKMMCDACRLYEAQSQFIERLFTGSDHEKASSGSDFHELEEKILNRMKDDTGPSS